MDWEMTVPHTYWSTPAEGFGQDRVLQNIRSSNMETGHDWLGGQGFPGKASESCFLG